MNPANQTTHEVSIYPGDIALEDVRAVFEVDYERPDRSVGDPGGYFATLLHIPFGHSALTREFLIVALGLQKVRDIELHVSDLINGDPASYLVAA